MSIELLGEALTAARRDEADEIGAALGEHRIVGVAGASEVGKSTLLLTELARYDDEIGHAVVHVDLAGTYSPRHLARRWLGAVARAVAGPIASLHITAAPRRAWPASTHEAEHHMRYVLRRFEDMLDEPQRRGRGGNEDIVLALEATARLATLTAGPVVLFIDHLEAPELSRAFKVRELLWQVRALSQEHTNVRVVLACRSGAMALAADERGAFFGDGTWLTITAPTLETWRRIVRDAPLDEIWMLTQGHVWSTFLIIDLMMRQPRLSARGALNVAMLQQTSLVARCVQHAASLHRIGPAMLQALANDRGPYEALSDAATRDIATAARRLELAGLIERSRPRVWKIVNPLVAESLRSPLGAPGELRSPRSTAPPASS